MPIQEPNVKTVAITQRAIPILICPFKISASELTNGKPGTSNNTLEASAICGSLPSSYFNAEPATNEATNAVTANTINGLKCLAEMIWRIYIANAEAINVIPKIVQSPPAKWEKQAQDKPTITTTK